MLEVIKLSCTTTTGQLGECSVMIWNDKDPDVKVVHNNIYYSEKIQFSLFL